jgi:hypothetical protein
MDKPSERIFKPENRYFQLINDSANDMCYYSTTPEIYFNLLTAPFTTYTEVYPRYDIKTLIGVAHILCQYNNFGRVISMEILIPFSKDLSYSADVILNDDGDVINIIDCIREGKTEYIIDFPQMIDTYEKIVQKIQELTK